MVPKIMQICLEIYVSTILATSTTSCMQMSMHLYHQHRAWNAWDAGCAETLNGLRRWHCSGFADDTERPESTQSLFETLLGETYGSGASILRRGRWSQLRRSQKKGARIARQFNCHLPVRASAWGEGALSCLVYAYRLQKRECQMPSLKHC
jgi:hypothetical protein